MATIEDIKKLRETTGAGMMDAKRALEEAVGDMARAVTLLRQRGQVAAAKKASREAREGLVEAYIHGGRVGVLVEVNCETDFVARTPDFREFAHNLALQIAAVRPQYVSPEGVPNSVIDAEKLVYSEATKGKPAEVAEKILSGKVEKFYAEVCLVKQPFIRDADVTIEQMLVDLVAKLGENIVIRRFERFELGETDA